MLILELKYCQQNMLELRGLEILKRRLHPTINYYQLIVNRSVFLGLMLFVTSFRCKNQVKMSAVKKVYLDAYSRHTFVS